MEDETTTAAVLLPLELEGKFGIVLHSGEAQLRENGNAFIDADDDEEGGMLFWFSTAEDRDTALGLVAEAFRAGDIVAVGIPSAEGGGGEGEDGEWYVS